MIQGNRDGEGRGPNSRSSRSPGVHVRRERAVSRAGDHHDSGEVTHGRPPIDEPSDSRSERPHPPDRRPLATGTNGRRRSPALAAAADRAGAAEISSTAFSAAISMASGFALEVAAFLTPPLPAEPARRPCRTRRAAALLEPIATGRRCPNHSFGSGRFGVDRANRRIVSPKSLAATGRQSTAPLGRPRSECRSAAARPWRSWRPARLLRARGAEPNSPDDMVRHLWEKHRLLMENGRAREPWDVIGQWVSEYLRSSRSDFLDRSCDLAQALDPVGGLARVHRLVLLGGFGRRRGAGPAADRSTENNTRRFAPTVMPWCRNRRGRCRRR